MLERQRMNGAVVAGLLIGMPVIEARATVMEFDEEGLTRMRPSLNYIQRSEHAAPASVKQVPMIDAATKITPAVKPTQISTPARIAPVTGSGSPQTVALASELSAPWEEILLASYVPMGALPEEEIGPEDGEPDEGMPEPDDVIIETGTGNLKPSLDALALAIPLEAITVLGASAAKRRDNDDTLDDDANVFAHLNDDPLAQLAGEIAIHHDIPPALFVALIEAESSFDPDAVSVKGAIGLTQLMPATAEELGVDPEDPVENMIGGARYLAAQFKRFGAWDLALAAYNAGPTRVARLGAVPDYAETRGFVARVIKGAAQSPVRLANLN